MSIHQEKGPTFVLRRICDHMQTKTAELLASFTNTQIQIQKNEQNISIPDHEQTRICNRTSSSEKSHFKAQEAFMQSVKNELCRMISSQLPTVVNYEAKINDRIQDLEQQLQECKKQVKTEKHNFKDSILQRDNLKVELLSKQHQSQQLADQLDAFKLKYDQAIFLLNTYVKEIQRLEAQVSKLQTLNANPNQDQVSDNFYHGPSPKSLGSPKYTSNEINYPLQMRQQLNEAQKVLNRSPRPNDLQMESSHFQLSSEIIGCQKQLLEIELKNSEKDKAQLILELEEERNYAKKLEKEVDNLEMLVDGEKRLNEKLDRELYTLINATKQMKIELLQEKAKNKQLEQEIFQMQQAISAHHKETTKLQQQITELQVAERKVPKLQDELNQMRAKLEISNKKYEELRKIKHQLEDKVEQFEAKLNQIQRKQSEDQVKNITFQQTVKSQNSSKIKQIQEMSLAIKMNYEKKIQVMEKHYNQLKDKYKYYKQQNAKLYEAFEVHSKKQAKLEDKYQKAHSRQQQLEEQFSTVKESLAINQQKLKTQTLLNKELKRELINAEKGKIDLEKNLKKLLHSKLPSLVSQIKLLKDEINAFKSAIQTYKEITKKISPKNLLQFQSMIHLILTQEKDKFNSLQSELTKKATLLEHWKKQAETSEDQKIKLIQRLNTLQTKEILQGQLIQAKQSELALLGQRFSLLESTNKKLEKQIENYRKIQKSGLEQIQILRQKQKQVEQFYSLVDELTEENKLLQKKLDEANAKNQDYVTFNKNQKSYFQYHSQNDLPINHGSLPSYLIPQKQSKQKSNSRSGESVSNSRSCAHLRPLSKNKSSIALIDPSKNVSFQKTGYHNHIKSQYEQTISNQLPIQSRPIMFNSRKSESQFGSFQAFPSDQMLDLREQKNLIKYNFENQRLRLEEIKQQYQKLMAEKFREDFIEKMATEKGNY